MLGDLNAFLRRCLRRFGQRVGTPRSAASKVKAQPLSVRSPPVPRGPRVIDDESRISREAKGRAPMGTGGAPKATASYIRWSL